MFLTGLEPLMEKVAARRGMKEIRKKIEAGDVAGAERMAITPGVLKKTQAGSQIKHLGAGMEGVSTLVAHPTKGVYVRKVIDPKGIAGPGMIAEREAAGKALQGSPDVAQFRGAYNTPSGLRAQEFDYVHGKPVPKDSPAAGELSTAVSPDAARATQARRGGSRRTPKLTPQQRADAQIKRLKLKGKREGFAVKDTHKGNVMMPEAGGSGKVVDFLAKHDTPVKGPDGKSQPYINKKNFQQAVGAQEAALKGVQTPYLDYLHDPRRSGNVMGRAFRSAPPLTPGSSTALREAREAKALAKNQRAQAPANVGRPAPAASLPSPASVVKKTPTPAAPSMGSMNTAVAPKPKATGAMHTAIAKPRPKIAPRLRI